MEIVNANDENSFDPTPRLKPSPIPIEFISFSWKDENCIYCGEKYIEALLTWQKYCKKCLSRYINDINDITDNNIYLDVYIYTTELECSEHEINRTKISQSIQECYGNCLIILCFKQLCGYGSVYREIDRNNSTLFNKVIESEENCKLCGKSLSYTYGSKEYDGLVLCSDCYIISSELIESALVKKQISVLYLPWWHNDSGFENSKNIGKYFLNELKSYYHCFKDKKGHIIETYGFTKDPELEDYIIVMEYASGGDLYKHLQKDFARITWNREKLRILHQISVGLETIHNKKFMHRDFHSGNILFDPKGKRTSNDDWKIGDLGLSQAVNSESSNNEVYGRDSNYTSELENNTDIESLSSQNLNSAIQKFPTALDSRYSSAELEPDINTESLSLYDLNFTIQNYSTALDSRYNSTELEFDIKTESLSLYDLNSTIQNYSTALDSRYVSAELDLDINTESILSQNLSSTLQNYSTALDFRYISTELELDIKTESFRSQNLSSTIQNFSTSLKKRRNEELLNVETHDDSGKRIKAG
ncbi:kinase-like domain-containing protein [Rhizophagus irregularis DAOM 181602=DAOM 197198]|nr:kinase-like domain-containing protein [Rhizophagus irregularis DAOM 181602=DAOM 197198]